MRAVLNEIKSFFLVLISLMLFVSLVTYNAKDPGWMHQSAWDAPIANQLGLFGAYCADLVISLTGMVSYLFPLFFLFSGIRVFRGKSYHQSIYHVCGVAISLLACMGILCLTVNNTGFVSTPAGGFVGFQIALALVSLFNVTGSLMILSAILIAGLSLSLQVAWYPLLQSLFNREKSVPVARSYSVPKPMDEITSNVQKPKIKATRKQPLTEPIANTKKPTIDATLLDKPEQKKDIDIKDYNLMGQRLQETLAEFQIEGQLVEFHPGPVVTRYEIDLAAGTKVSKISALSKDLARNLSVTAVRVVEVIAGKNTIGIEIPNAERDIVSYRDILESKAFHQTRATLPLALGKDISGHPVVVDLTKMPHLLVAGTTGSGKSVGLNSMLLSLLYKEGPESLKLIMIDPKMLELSVYQDIPHLLTPVVTDMNLAAQSLSWCVEEMERRYMLMAALGVRNIAGYNEKVKKLKKAGKSLFDSANEQFQDRLQGVELECLPHIVVVADEFADLIMVVGKKIEQLIARLAQKARASGIHIILATQRPSVDVITGLIKANIPTRIAFQVSSKIDSRTILDQQGAEQLLGNGDMLYLPPGSGIPVRIHGAFVSDDEVNRVCKQLKQGGSPNYIDIFHSEESAETSKCDAEISDPLYDEAVEFVVSSQKVSVSSVQRKLRVGYNRAANIVEAMEKAGVVSDPGVSGTRKVLVQSNE